MADQIADAFAAYQRGDYLRATRCVAPSPIKALPMRSSSWVSSYANGKGVRQSYPQAADWAVPRQMTARTLAQNNLGLILRPRGWAFGEAMTRRQTVRQAADRGNPRAQLQSGRRLPGWQRCRAGLRARLHVIRSVRRPTGTLRSASKPLPNATPITKQMTPGQVTRAQADATDWKPTLLHSALPPTH